MSRMRAKPYFRRNDYILEMDNYKELLTEASHNVMTIERGHYNCGGFALGTFNWYLPYARCTEYHEKMWEIREDMDYGALDYDEGCDAIAEIYVDFMCSEGLCRRIDDSSELCEGEYLVAFKASYDDFHYARRLANGRWFHKMGGSEIEEISEEDAFDYDWWNNLSCEYGGSVWLLAVPYSNSKR